MCRVLYVPVCIECTRQIETNEKLRKNIMTIIEQAERERMATVAENWR